MRFRESAGGAILAVACTGCVAASASPPPRSSMAQTAVAAPSGGSHSEPSDGSGTETLTGSDCRSDLPKAIPAGLVELSLVNETDSQCAGTCAVLCVRVDAGALQPLRALGPYMVE